MVFILGVLIGSLVAVGSDVAKEPDPSMIDRLVERVNTYTRLDQERKYADSYEMLATQWREGPEDKKEWVNAGRKMDNGLKILDWRIKEIRLCGNLARVVLALKGKARMGIFKWREIVEKQNDYWLLEDKDWFFVPAKPPDWDETKSIEVPVPGDSGMRLNVITR